MKKAISTILLCVFILYGVTGCKEKPKNEHSFCGKVLEISSSYMIVEPNKDEEERKSSDKFRIDLKNDDTTYEIGTNVKITYMGGINESYPAQIETTKIEIDESKGTIQNYSKTIEDVNLEMKIPSEWKYEELSRDENNDFYKYALKLYKGENTKNAILYFYNNPFTVCGTGRTNKNMTLDNKEQATVGYYNNTEWSDISFYELNPNIAFINYGLEGEEAKEVLDFVRTINISKQNK